MRMEVQSPDLGILELVLNSTDDQGSPVSKTFKLLFDYRAIKRAEDELGIDLRDFSKWLDIVLKPSMTPALVHVGLAKYHPEVTLEEITDLLHPSAQGALQDAITELLFPGVLDKLRKAREDAEKEASVPNVPSGESVAA